MHLHIFLRCGFLTELVEKIIQLMSKDYPNLIESELLILDIIKIEETKFIKAMKQGLRILKKIILNLI